MLVLLVFLLSGLLVANYVMNDKEILAPSVIFSASFLLSCLWALMYQNKWDLNLHMNTFFVILGGVLEFSLIAYGVSTYFNNKRTIQYYDDLKSATNPVTVSDLKIVLVILIEIVAIFYTIHEVKIIAPADSLSASIYSYRSRAIDPIASLSLPSSPKSLGWLRSITEAAGYFFAYLLARNVVLYKKVSLKYLVIILLSICSDLLLGSRTGSFTLMICFLVYMYSFYKQKNHWKSDGNIKAILIYGAVFLVIMLIFQSLATLLGRSVNQMSKIDYLALYVGAEIKNLDIFLQSGSFPIHTGYFGGQTFIALNKVYAHIVGNPNLKLTLDIPYQHINGYSLGNVYTTFYSYIYDFGYIGVPVLTGLMAFLSQYFFERVKLIGNTLKVSIFLLIYSKIVANLALSFFSNKFYEELFTTSFLKLIIFWALFNLLFFKKNNDKLVSNL